MSIPESQLQTWSHQGSIQQSSSTYQAVKSALEHSSATYSDKNYKVFLQGSYGNDTNIYAESDVDTVIRLDSIYRGDVSSLPWNQQVLYQQTKGSATYNYNEFKNGVVARLIDAFSASHVTPENKAIKIKANSSRRSADVIACYEYRRYTRFFSYSDCEYISGIIFPSINSGEIINYPQLHSKNLTAKHQATSGWFKPMARILKNMRSHMVAKGKIPKSLAPSYYIEGMLYNAPNSSFRSSFGDTFCSSINWLRQADRSKLVCAHEQYYLLGNSNVQWPAVNCTSYLDALVDLWNNW